MRLTAKERILLHLLESARLSDDVEVPPTLTQEGVAHGAGIERRHVVQVARPLVKEGLVSEQTAHVRGIRQRRKVYDLTPSGRASAIRLREKLKTETVRTRDGTTVCEESLQQALQRVGTRASLLKAVRQIQETGVLDLQFAKGPSESGFVEMMSDAPRIGTFAGRREELAEITREDGNARVFVIRGMAGIGKTALAARACDSVRGRRNLFWHRIRPWESDLTILAAVGRFLEILDRPGLASILRRTDPAMAAEVLRRDLPGTQAFLVFDDAHVLPAKALDVLQMLMEAAGSAPDVRILVLTRLALPFYGVRDLAPSGIVREIDLSGLKPEEAAAFLSAEGGPGSLAGLGRQLAGHPLFLELFRAHRTSRVKGLRDIQRFFEEEIWTGLSRSEQTILKACCLYQMPVPQAVVLSTPNSSFEALLSLKGRSLIRSVGGERYEIHDTIRDIIRSTLSSEEYRTFRDGAVLQLRALASEASKAGDVVGCIQLLSNALLVAQSHADRLALCEALGDANERVGDMLGLSMAYREGITLTSDPESLARLHRKLASALWDRGHLVAASAEIDAGCAALGTLASVERGWLDLVSARVSGKGYDFRAAEYAAESSLRVFEQFKSSQGRAEALLELGRLAMWTGRRNEDGESFAGPCLRSALEQALSLNDSALAARIHLASAEAIGYGSGDFSEGMRHFDAVQSMSATASAPTIQAAMYTTRAWFRVRVALDLAGAELDLAEGRRLAGKIHDADSLMDAMYQSAFIVQLRGHYKEAASRFEEAGLRRANAGIMGLGVDSLVNAACNYLADADWESYRRITSVLGQPAMAHAIQISPRRASFASGLDALVRKDIAGFESAFAEHFRIIDGDPPQSMLWEVNAWRAHFYYSLGLRLLGRGHEAAEHRRRAQELLEALNNQSGLKLMASDFGERIVHTIRAGWKVAGAPAAITSRSASSRGSPTPSTSRRSSGRPGRKPDVPPQSAQSS